jgi:hypothetical protein
VDVELIAHLEVVSGAFAWWGESPQVPTLSATASELRPMIEVAMEAILEVLSERGDTLGHLTVTLADAKTESLGGPPEALTVRQVLAHT